MKWSDIRISSQLRLGLGVIMALAVVLGVMGWWQSSRLWSQTEALYTHPLMVRRAIGRLERNVESMSRLVRDLLLNNSESEMGLLVQEIEVGQADSLLLIDRLRAVYHGPAADLDALQDNMIRWRVLRDETLRLIRDGKRDEAEARIRHTGVQGRQADAVRRSLRRIDESAMAVGDQFYRDAEERMRFMGHQFTALVAVILLLSLFVARLVLKGIRTPLAELTAAARQFHQGKLEVRSPYQSRNEFGVLSAAFNTMADSIEAEIKAEENVVHLSGIMLSEADARMFFRELLKALMEHTGSQVGVVYLLNDAGTHVEHFESIGLGASARRSFSVRELEGEMGAVLATRRIQRVGNIPPDTRFVFHTTSVDLVPREIISIPVISGQTVAAVVSLASVRAFDGQSMRLVNEIWSVLTARVNGVLAAAKLQALAIRLEQQNSELETQKSELAAQASELAGQNTELALQKRQLDEANRLKSAFLSNMSHELRTPLNSVIALAGVLSRRLEKTLPVEEYGYLQVIERNGRNLLSMINDILDLSRIEAGRADINVSRFSIRDLVGEVVEMIAPQAREKNIRLVNLVSDRLPVLESDADKCRHILQNLVGNAVKFTEQGDVTVNADIRQGNARTKGPMISISVTDTGIGIAADQIERIFDEFRQADDSTARRFGGTGLGLAISRKYALLLGGGIAVDSHPGKGSVFVLHLPLELPSVRALPAAERTAGVPAGPAPAKAPVSPVCGANILLVEDNEPAVAQIVDILKEAGYCFEVARNGREALERIAWQIPDAVILDLMMPEVDGFQVLRDIRGSERTASIPVLILTAKHVTREELSVLKGNDIHQLIQKGDINREGLLAAIARMVSRPRPATAPVSGDSG